MIAAQTAGDLLRRPLPNQPGLDRSPQPSVIALRPRPAPAPPRLCPTLRRPIIIHLPAARLLAIAVNLARYRRVRAAKTAADLPPTKPKPNQMLNDITFLEGKMASGHGGPPLAALMSVQTSDYQNVRHGPLMQPWCN